MHEQSDKYIPFLGGERGAVGLKLQESIALELIRKKWSVKQLSTPD